MKKTITIIPILFATIFYSHTNKTNNYKYGFINENGKEVTSLKYDNAYSFSEGIATVCVNKKWGFINKHGKEITPIKYDTVYNCKSGVARIKVNGKYGLIDTSGKEITSIKYDNIGRFDYDVACVKINGKWGIINNKGIEITPLKYDYMQKTNAYSILCLKGEDKNILMDENRNPIEANSLGYFNDNTSYFDESGIAKVCVDGKWGFIDKTGKEISAIKYDYVFFFSEGMARVLLDNKYGFIDKLGNEVIPLTYDFIHERFSSRPSCVDHDSEKAVYFYKNGSQVKYKDGEFLNEQNMYFNNGLACLPINNLYGFDRYIFIDKKGKEITSTKYGPVAPYYYSSGRTKKQFYFDGLRMVKNEKDRKYGFADTLGNLVIPMKYESAYDFKNDVGIVSENGKFGLINKEGESITQFKYSGIWGFYDGIASVNIKENHKSFWGIIDYNGRELTPIKYDFIDDFKEGLAIVKINGKMGFIDRKGDEIITPKYTHGTFFYEGFAQVVYGEKVGFVDKTGKEITLIKYDQTHGFKNGYGGVGIRNKWGFINKIGQEITPLKYDEIDDYEEELAVVKILVDSFKK